MLKDLFPFLEMNSNFKEKKVVFIDFNVSWNKAEFIAQQSLINNELIVLWLSEKCGCLLDMLNVVTMEQGN